MKKLIFIFLLLFIPIMPKAITVSDFQNAVSEVSISASTTYSNEFAYSFYWGGSPSNPVKKDGETSKWLNNAYKGIKSSGYIYGSTKSKAGIKGSFTDKFGVFCESFVRLMMYHASNGTLDYYKDFEKIPVSDLKKGDFIHFPSHIAIFIDDNFDNNDSTFNVVEASKTVHYSLTSREADYGVRIKESALAKLDYNHLFSSYDFHDRLDDHGPVINNVTQKEDKILIDATDYKHYELSSKSDILEPENNGIVGYQITTNNIEPTSWKKLDRVTILNREVEGVVKGGTYYVWVIDVGGNVANYVFNAKDYIKDVNNIGTLKYEVFVNEINVSIDDSYDSDGIKEYRYYLNGNLINNSSDNTYKYVNLDSNKEYDIYYEIIDNKGNTYKSEPLKITTLKNVTSLDILEEDVTIRIGETYKINSQVTSINNNYVITYSDFDNKIITVSKEGLVTAINEGMSYINVRVDDKVKVIKVNVIENDNVKQEVVVIQEKEFEFTNILIIFTIVVLVIVIFFMIYKVIKSNSKKR